MKHPINTRFTYTEELANATSHLVGAVLAIVALVTMIIYGTVWHVVSASVFGGALVLLYLSSTLNHWLPVNKAKEFFFNFDKIAIYLLIAGTYTPLTIIALNSSLGWTILGIEWLLTLIGIIIIILKPGKFAKSVGIFFMLSYIVMGWIVLIAIPQVISSIGINGFLWILTGGLMYTIGTLFFKFFKFKFHHLIWHLFVLAGSICHFIAIYYYVLKL